MKIYEKFFQTLRQYLKHKKMKNLIKYQALKIFLLLMILIALIFFSTKNIFFENIIVGIGIILCIKTFEILNINKQNL
jgi:uncharacterized membrane protein